MVSKTIATKRFIGKDVPDAIAFPLVLERLMERRNIVQLPGVPGECWEYLGYRHATGYAMTIYKTKPIRVHRLIHIILKGPIPDGYDVMHSCDNPPCFNPDHLEAATTQANIRDCVSKGRQAQARKTHCPRGHAYAEHGRFYQSDACIQQANPWRSCRICQRAKQRQKMGWPESQWYLPPIPKNTNRSKLTSLIKPGDA